MAYAKINSLEEEGIRKTNEIEKTDIVFEKLEERLKKSEDPKYKKGTQCQGKRDQEPEPKAGRQSQKVPR
jgi:hypothetical protein